MLRGSGLLSDDALLHADMKRNIPRNITVLNECIDHPTLQVFSLLIGKLSDFWNISLTMNLYRPAEKSRLRSGIS
jgi:hypothetical protein